MEFGRDFFYLHFHIIFLQASLISAVFISCERFYAVYGPAIVASAMYFILANLILVIAAYYVSVIIFSIFFIHHMSVTLVFGENHGKMRTISSHQQTRTAQNQRLTKTLLFVAAAAAVLAWPMVSLCNCRVFIECSQDLSSLAGLLHHNLLTLLSIQKSTHLKFLNFDNHGLCGV